MTERRDDYASDSEVHVLLAGDESEDLSESDNVHSHSHLCSGKETGVLDNSRVSITSKKLVLKVYKRRWFILGLFSLLSFMQVS